MRQQSKTETGGIPREHLLATTARASRWLAAFLLVTWAALLWQLRSPRAEELLVAVAAAGALVGIPFVALLSARRLRRPDRDPLGLGRIAVVGEIASLYRALGAGAEALGGRPELLLVDGPQPAGKRLRRVRVGDIAKFDQALVRGRIDRAVLVPPLSPSLAGYVMQRCLAAGRPCVRVGELVPSLSAARATVAAHPEVLLGGPQPERTPHDIYAAAAAERSAGELISGRRVLVVGAGSPLGRQLALEVLRHGPGMLFLADGAGADLDGSERIAGALAVCDVEARLVDLRDAAAVFRLLGALRPSVVLHAAAPRRVVLAERHPAETALDILSGTRSLVEAAESAGVERLLFVSSLGAARPTSVVGATLRAAELYVQAGAAPARPRLVAIRLPCLLGAPGGVLHAFLDQLERGLPITVAHPEVERRFMTPPQAARLCLHAVALGRSGDLYTAGGGAAVRIATLADRLIACAGLRTGVDVPMQFTGLGPGERLKEHMTQPEDLDRPIRPPSLMLAGARGAGALAPHIGEGLDLVVGAARTGRDDRVVQLLAQLVPDYEPASLHRAGPRPDIADRDEDLGAPGPRAPGDDSTTAADGASAMTVIAGGVGP